MPIVVYKMDASPPSRTVLITAEILGLQIETREVSLPNDENFKPEYMEKNILHTIPLLEEGDFILTDSHAIIIYLVSKYDGDNATDLYPTDLRKRANIQERLFLDASILFPRLNAIVRAIAHDHATRVDELQTVRVNETYYFLDKYLEKSLFLTGENLTIADIACITTVSSLNLLVPISARYSNVLKWFKKLSSYDWYVNKNQPGLKDLDRFLKFHLQKNSADLQFLAEHC